MLKISIGLLDFILAFLLWAAAVWLRIRFGEANAPQFMQYMKFGLLISTLTVLSFSYSGLYESLHFRSRTNEFFNVLRANVVALFGFILLGYFFSGERISRGSLLIYTVFSFVVYATERLMLVTVLRREMAKVRNQSRILLVGEGEALEDYIRTVGEHRHLGINVVGWADGPTEKKGSNLALGTFKELHARFKPDAVVISYAPERSNLIDSFLRDNYNDLTKIYVLPAFRSYALLGLRLEDFAGLPILAVNQPEWRMRDIIAKRLLDFTGAFCGLLVLSPLLFILSILVKLTSPGPIFFGQERMGLDGKTFKMWKFRSMKAAPPGVATTGWTVANDPRRTKFGTFLRSTSLDELPQFWNVLVGDMSLVGPRPEQPHYVETFRNEIPAYMLRHKMKAGITGWAQVNGWRGDTSLHSRIECDLYYIKNWSLTLDFKILLLTIWKGFVNRNAY